jgi:hypothetical protein
MSAATGGSSLAASSGTEGAQTVGASATTVPPPAALNLAMQVGDCLLSAGMSANDVVVAMLGITDGLRTDTGSRRRDLHIHLGVPLSCAGGAANHLHQSGAAVGHRLQQGTRGGQAEGKDLTRSPDRRSREGIRSHPGGSPAVPTVGGDDRGTPASAPGCHCCSPRRGRSSWPHSSPDSSWTGCSPHWSSCACPRSSSNLPGRD